MRAATCFRALSTAGRKIGSSLPSAAVAPAAVRPFSVSSVTAASPAPSTGRVFNGFTVYKPEACLNLRVVHPRWTAGGYGGNFLTMREPGRLTIGMATNTNAGGDKNTPAVYDWANKITFSLGARQLVQLAGFQFTSPVSFSRSYDEDDGSGNKARKVASLTIAPKAATPGAEGPSYTITAAVSPADKASSPQNTITAELSVGDLALLKHLISQSIVWVTGWQMNLDPTLFDPSIHLVREPAAGGAGKQ